MPEDSHPANDDPDPAPVQAPDPPSRRDPELVERILAVALAMFEERGFDAVSVSQIAARAGVSPVTIYRTFGTKAGIVFWPRDRSIDALRALASSQPKQLDARAAVAGCMRARSATEPIDRETYGRMLRIIATSPRLQLAAHSTHGELEQALLIGLGGPDGQPPLNLRVACAAGASALVEAARSWHQRGTRSTWAAETEAVLSALWPDLINKGP